MDFNQDIDKQLAQYFNGTINNVDKDLIDILAMTDDAVAKKFNTYKRNFLNSSKKASRINWKLPTALGLAAGLTLFLLWDRSPATDPINNNPKIEQQIIHTTTSNEKIETKPNLDIDQSEKNAGEEVIIKNETQSQELLNTTPTIIFAPKATSEQFDLLELESNTIPEVVNSKKTDSKNKLPKLRKGNRPTVVPIEDSGF